MEEKIMNKKLLLVLVFPFFLTSCIGSGQNKSSQKSDSNTVEITKYLDEEPYSSDSFSITLKSLNCYETSSGNYQIMFYIIMKNLSPSKQTYLFSNSSYVRESSGYGYETNVMNITYQNKQELEPDMSMTPCYLSSIPTDIKTEKYYLTSTINNLKYKLYLYNSDGSFYNGWGNF